MSHWYKNATASHSSHAVTSVTFMIGTDSHDAGCLIEKTTLALPVVQTQHSWDMAQEKAPPVATGWERVRLAPFQMCHDVILWMTKQSLARKRCIWCCLLLTAWWCSFQGNRANPRPECSTLWYLTLCLHEDGVCGWIYLLLWWICRETDFWRIWNSRKKIQERKHRRKDIAVFFWVNDWGNEITSHFNTFL